MSDAARPRTGRFSGVSEAGLSALSGAAAALGHAPFGLWPLGFLGFTALIWLVAGSGRPGRTAWFGGVAYFAVALHWIVEPFQVDAAVHGWLAPFALIGMAGGLALFWMAAGCVSRRSAWSGIAFAVALAGAEMLRGYVLTGFPWALPAYVWIDTPVAQLASLIGPFGLTTLTLLVAALLAQNFPNARAIGLTIAVSLAAVALGWTITPTFGQGEKTVRLVQPNAPQHQKWDPELASGFVRRALDFTGEPMEDVDLVIWPETTITWPLDIAGPVLEAATARSGGIPVLTGINRREDERWFNSAIMIEGGGAVTETYDKVHLVPFGEYIPFRSDLIRGLAARSSYGFEPGAAVRLIETPLGRALPLICYEAIFPRHGAGAGRPDVLIQITNDAWFGAFSGPYQHLDQARFRAIEQGLPLLRAANTGVSAVIDPAGRVVASLALNEAGFLDHPVPQAAPPTLYARIGDWPFGVALLVALAFASLKSRRKTD